jgi:hypothetical protein
MVNMEYLIGQVLDDFFLCQIDYKVETKMSNPIYCITAMLLLLLVLTLTEIAAPFKSTVNGVQVRCRYIL